MPRGRPKGGKNRKYDYEFKLKLVKEYLNEHLSYWNLENKYGVNHSVIERWVKLYNKGLLETGQKRTGNPFSALHTSKSLSREERLELENLMGVTTLKDFYSMIDETKMLISEIKAKGITEEPAIQEKFDNLFGQALKSTGLEDKTQNWGKIIKEARIINKQQ